MRAFVVTLAAVLALVSIIPAALGQNAERGNSEPLAILGELGLIADPVPAAFTDAAMSGNSREVFAECCRICRKGKACGNSCIQRTETCEQPPGCACDGE